MFTLFILCVLALLTFESGIALTDNPSALCYSQGQAFMCMPPFYNIAEELKVEASSTCGNPAKTICRDWVNSDLKTQTSCDFCDASQSGKTYPAKFLTDRHVSNNQTSWISGPVKPGDVVNLTLSVNKRFEVYYISLQPSGILPDAVAMYKSSDFGKSWRPWHYFSTNCYRAFGKATSVEGNTHITAANIQEVLCMDLKKFRPNSNGDVDTVIAFSTTIGRPSAQPWSPALIDWMTMTDLRISFIRFSDSPKIGRKQRRRRGQRAKRPKITNPNLLRLYNDYPMPGLPTLYSDQGEPVPTTSTNNLQPDDADDDETEENVVHYAFSDLAVGGRCKCNGHASACIVDKQTKQLRCDCQHNTEGVDCERCKASYLDRPWARATNKDPNVCKKCDCHLHTNKCKFSKETYLLSARISGGVCEKCRHNTGGRQCHYCKDGYYRDWTKPVSHENVCLVCRCHPIGSMEQGVCDKKTGQCMCKAGVSGTSCSRCKEGYKQTKNKDNPCALITGGEKSSAKTEGVLEFSQNSMSMPSAKKCNKCNAAKKRIRFKKFCRKQLIFQVTMHTREDQIPNDSHKRFQVRVDQVWRQDTAADNLIKGTSKGRILPVWINGDDLDCHCPNLQLGLSYLIITDVNTYKGNQRLELLLNRKSIALPWQDSWRRRLIRFKRREKRGKCSKFDATGRNKILRVGHRKRGKANSRSYNTSPYRNPLYSDPYNYQSYPQSYSKQNNYNLQNGYPSYQP